MAKDDSHFSERLQNAAKAKQALLAAARAKSPLNDPGFADRQAERVALAAAREQRKAETAERKRIEAARIAEEKAIAAEAARVEAEALLNQKANEIAALKAQQKANRDAKYQARQARRDSRRAS
jgi:hypothetical protein